MSFEKILKFLLGLFLFLLPWQTIWIFRETFVDGIKLEYSTLGFYATEVLLWIVIVVFIVWYLRNLKLEIVPQTGSRLRSGRNWKLGWRLTRDRIFVLAVLSLISYLSLSLFWSADKSLALQQSLRVIEAFLLFFILLLGPLKKESAIKWLALGSILPCVLGIWQFLTQSTFASTLLGLASHPAWQAGASVVASDTIGRWLRAYGPFAHPNVFGGYLVIVLILLQILDFRFQNKKISFIIYHLLLITALFFTFSRAAWGAAIVGFSIIQFLSLRNRKNFFHLLSLISIVIILFTIFFPLIQTRLAGNSISETRAITDRIGGYSDAWKLFKKDPILGVGAGNYTVALWHSDKWRPAWEIQPAHNAWALFVVETGVIGVLLLLFVIVSFSQLMIHVSRCNKFVSCYVNRVSYLLLFTIYFLLSLFDHYLYSSYIGLMLSALFFGLMLRKSNENTVSPQLIHHNSFDTTNPAWHNTSAKEPVVGAGA